MTPSQLDEKLNLPLAPEVAELPLRILLVEDMDAMASWIKHHIDPIREEFPHATIQIVKTWEQAKVYLFSEPAPHVVCLDLILPLREDEHGKLEGKMEWHQTVDQVPRIEAKSAVVIITGQDASMVRDRLLDKEVEVIMKGPDMFERFFLIRAIVRALQRWKKNKAQENLRQIRAGSERVDEILEGLKRLEARYATTPK